MTDRSRKKLSFCQCALKALDFDPPRPISAITWRLVDGNDKVMDGRREEGAWQWEERRR